MDPFLVSRRSGRTTAMVVALGFGGGTVLLGVTSAAAGALNAAAILPALWGYFLAALPFFFVGAVLASCRRELWVVPGDGEADAEGAAGKRVLRMLTYRPWLVRGPRVEQAPITEYRGLCLVDLDHRAERSTVAVALIPAGGEAVPVREFEARDEAEAFIADLATATGLPRVRAEAQADEAA